MTAKGTVKGNIVILDEGEKLPDGARVEIRVIEATLSTEDLKRREEAFNRVVAHAIHRPIGMDEIWCEARQEVEERLDRWIASQRRRCVVNASVALKWHLTHEPFALQALDLLNDWRKGDLDLLAPDIFFAEISHALVRAIRRGRLSPDEAKIVLSDLLAVAVQMFPTRLLVQRAMEIAL